MAARRWYALYASPGRGKRFPLDEPYRYLTWHELVDLRAKLRMDGLVLYAYKRAAPTTIVQPPRPRTGSGRRPRVPVQGVHTEEIDGKAFTVTTFAPTGSTRQRPFTGGKVTVSMTPDGQPIKPRRRRKRR